MLRAILFDLDDTLYPEAEFYRSGFRAVAAEIARRTNLAAQPVRELLEQIHFCGGRQRVFDAACETLAVPSGWVPELVSLFRAHAPEIRLPAASRDVLVRLRARYRLGIVTDGHAAVQRGKIEALGLSALVDAIVVCDDLGREHWKPDPLPFLTCCQALHVRPAEAVFLGDNPQRDVCGARRAGLTPIRLRSGYFDNCDGLPGEPHPREIARLDELEAALAQV